MALFEHLNPSVPADIVEVLNFLYASEVVAAEQYYSHWVSIKGPASLAMQQMLEEHAQQERGHADKLRRRIHDLGGRLDNSLARVLARHQIFEDGDGDVQHASSYLDICRTGFMSEQRAVAAYTEACFRVRDFDPATYLTLQEILRDEEEHLREFHNLLEPDQTQ